MALRKLIEERVGPGAHYKTTAIQSVESLMSREPTAREQAAARGNAEENDRLAAEPEVQAAVTSMLRSHYRKWIDEQIPALNNRTPREVVRDRDGAEAVEALLLQIERDSALMSPPMDPDIVREMRETLGLNQRG